MTPKIEETTNGLRWYRFDKALGINRGELFSIFITLVFGAIIGWAISTLISSPKKIELWAVLFIGLIALFVCVVVVSFLTAFQEEGRSRLDMVSLSLAKVERSVIESIEGSAVLIPRESIYPEMAKCIREAEEQVVVITYFMYDWENNVRTFEPTVAGNVEGVDEFYEAIYACIKDPATEYLRVWQVPQGRVDEARDKIMLEDRLRREIELIDETAPHHADWCRLKIISAATTASIILVDRKTLFFNIDLFDTERNQWMSPFMLMVRDARGRAFNDLKRVIAKLST